MPAGTPDRIALAVSGDDAGANQVAIALVDTAGFDAVDAGGLADSWRQQPGTAAYCTDVGKDALSKALLAANRAKAPQLRDAALQKLMALPPGFSVDDVIKINRSLHG